jgi:hypothetical protein
MNEAINNFNRAVNAYKRQPENRANFTPVENAYIRLVRAFGATARNGFHPTVPMARVLNWVIGPYYEYGSLHPVIIGHAQSKRLVNMVKRQRKVQKLRREVTARAELRKKGLTTNLIMKTLNRNPR